MSLQKKTTIQANNTSIYILNHSCPLNLFSKEKIYRLTFPLRCQPFQLLFAFQQINSVTICKDSYFTGQQYYAK